MTKPVEITLEDLFNAIDEKYQYITVEKNTTHKGHLSIQAWEFEPQLKMDLGSYTWWGATKTNEELGYTEDLEELSSETPYFLFNGWIFTVKDFENLPTEKCIACRKNYM